MSGNTSIDGLLGSYKWASSNLTFGFPTTYVQYGASYGSGENVNNFAPLSATQQAAVRGALSTVASVINVSFTELTNAAAKDATLRFGLSDQPLTAWAYFPSTRAEGGDVWLNNSSGTYSNPVKGNAAYFTILHEIGHALGLEHAHEGNPMPVPHDSMEFTVMSYRSYAGASMTGYPNESWGYAQSLMLYDIAALQHMYGANYSTNANDTIYKWSPTTGEMFINGVGQGAPGANRVFQTIWDGGGTDTYDFSAYATNLRINLQPGAWSTTSLEQLAKLRHDGSKVAAGNIANALLYQGSTQSLIENAKGGSGNDSIIGNSAANDLYGEAGNDRLFGGAGNDRLFGGPGNDRLWGGAGADRLDGGDGSDTAVYSQARSGVVADLLTPSANTGEAAGDVYISIENLLGSAFDDILWGDNSANLLQGGPGNDQLYGRGGNDRLVGGAGSDHLHGGTGNDHLEGGAGADQLYGGSGADTFVFRDFRHSPVSARDVIHDFEPGIDKIDLRGMDADVMVGGTQKFIFIGDQPLSGVAGQLGFVQNSVIGDVDSDGVADFAIRVLGVSSMFATDFLL